MNERIKELAKCNERIENFFVTGPVQRAAIEEFADLLIDECIKMVEAAPLHNCYTTFDKSMAEGTKHDIVKFLKLSLK